MNDLSRNIILAIIFVSILTLGPPFPIVVLDIIALTTLCFLIVDNIRNS